MRWPSIDWHMIGSIGTGLVQVEKDGFNWHRIGQSALHWQNGSNGWFKWHRIGSIGTGLVNRHSFGKLAQDCSIGIGLVDPRFS